MALDPFLLRALVAGLITAVIAGPLGAFVVWRRMAYFGDAVSHAAILGVALALGFDISIFVGTLVTAVSMALLVTTMSRRGWAIDTLLGVLAHAALAIGLVAVSFLPTVRVDLSAYLFGDILTVTYDDLWAMAAGAAVVLGLLIWRWDALLTATISEDLATSLGQNPARERLILTMAMAITVAVAIKVIGALLIAAMLIIPAASARVYARGPESMAVIASLMGAGAVCLGLWASLTWDTPAGPSIIVAATISFVVSVAIQQMRPRG